MARPSTAESIKEYFSNGTNRKKWEEAKAKAKEAASFGNYDDGKYEAQLVDVKVGRSQASNRLQVTFSFKFTEGEYKGKTFRKYIGIEDGMEYLFRDLAVLGYDDVDMDDLEDTIFKELKKKKPTIQVNLKTKEGTEYQNVFLLAPTEKEESEDEDDDDDDSEADESEDDDEKSEDDDADDDEDGEEDTEDEDSEDDEDEKEETPKKKASKSKEKDDDEDEDKADVDEDEGEKVELTVGMKLKVQHKNEVVKVKVVKIDESDEDSPRIKVKLPGGEKVWVVQKDIVDVVA